MFLIQYGAGMFVNANNISWVDFSEKGSECFGIIGDAGCEIKIHPEFASIFFNHLQALNGSHSNIEACWSRLQSHL